MRTRFSPIGLTTGAIRRSKMSPAARPTSVGATQASRPAVSVENVVGGASTGVSGGAVMCGPFGVRVLAVGVGDGCELVDEDGRDDAGGACAERGAPAGDGGE